MIDKTSKLSSGAVEVASPFSEWPTLDTLSLHATKSWTQCVRVLNEQRGQASVDIGGKAKEATDTSLRLRKADTVQ